MRVGTQLEVQWLLELVRWLLAEDFYFARTQQPVLSV
jgi:hypothetical protein